MKLTRDLFIPLLDRNKLVKSEVEGYDWVRVDKSTVFALSFNPQEETFGYIDAPNDSTEVVSYQPELPQEIVLDSANPLYSAMFDFVMGMPLGSDAVVPCLLAMPSPADPNAVLGYLWDEALISPQELNTVDGKLTFTIKLNGVKKNGTVTAADGVYTFTPSAQSSPSE